MSRTFTLSGEALTLANAAVTLGFINPPASPNVALEFYRMWAGEGGTPAANQQRIQIETQVTAFPTLTSATPAKNNKGTPNVSVIVGGTAGAAGTSGVNASAEGAGSKTVHQPDVFHIQNGWLWVPNPKEVITIPAGLASGIGVFLPVAATTLTAWCVGMVYGEV